MATIASTATGNWNDGSTWVGGIAPGDGDSATTSAGHTVTIPVGVTVTVGTSPATGGTAAINAAGPLVINGTLYAKGDIKHSHASGCVLGPGSRVEFVVDTGKEYRWHNGTSYGNYSPITINGTTGSHATITKSGVGDCKIGGTASNSCGLVLGTFGDFSNIGAAAIRAIDAYFSGARTLSLTDCTFTNCGTVQGNNMGDGDSLILLRNTFSGTLSTYSVTCDQSTARTTGTRSITWNSTDKPMSIGFRNFTVENNWFGDGYYCMSSAAGRDWASFTRNLVARTTSAGSVINTCYSWSSCVGVIRDSSVINPHPFEPSAVNQDTTISGCVFDGITPDNDGDWFLPTTSTPASFYKLTITDNNFLPGPRGDNLGTPLTCYGNAKLEPYFRRNTYCMGKQGVSFGESGGYTGYAGMWKEFYSNLAWNASVPATGGFVAWDGLGTAYDAVAGSVTTPDYNGKWNHGTTWATAGYDATSLARGYLTGSSGGANYAFTAATTPGDHDVTGDPGFHDSDRCLARFDQDYLGKAQGTAWADATGYVVGDIVSATTSGVWGGRAINYRCILAHTSSSGSSTLGMPGLGTAGTGNTKSWSTRWELASDYWMRSSLAAGTTYTDATLGITAVSVIEAFRKWVLAGFAPSAATYQLTGYGGERIGAVDWAAVSAGSAIYMTGGGEGPAFGFLEA